MQGVQGSLGATRAFTVAALGGESVNETVSIVSPASEYEIEETA